LHPYILAPITTMVLAAGLGTYVLLKDPKDTFRRAFFMLTFWTFLASISEVGMLTTTDADVATRLFHIKWVGMAFVEPAVLELVLAASLWAAKWEHPARQFWIYVPPIAFIVLDAMGGIMNGVQLQPWGYEAVYSSLFMLWPLFWFVYIGIGVLVLAMDLKDRTSGYRPVYMTLLIGILIPTIIDGISEGTNRYLGTPNIITSYLALILFLIFFEIAIYRRRIFVPIPKKETIKGDVKKSKLVLPPGHIYRLEGEQPSVTYELFRGLVLSDLFGLIISRKPPEGVRVTMGLEETPIVWLSSTPKEGVRTVAPTEIGQIVFLVKEFIKKAEGTVVLLDGLEFLIFQNGPKITLSALFLLSETISVSNSRVLIPTDPKAIDPATMALIQRETVDIRTVKGFERGTFEKT